MFDKYNKFKLMKQQKTDILSNTGNDPVVKM